MSTEAPPPAGELCAANRRCHDHLDELWLDFLEALMVANLPSARTGLERFQAALLAHAGFEDEQVLPRFAALGPPDDDPKDRTPEHVAGDHKILRRTLAIADEELAGLEANVCSTPATVRQVAAVLEPFVRLRSVLSHHDSREQSRMYPRLDAALGAEDRQALAAELRMVTGVRDA